VKKVVEATTQIAKRTSIVGKRGVRLAVEMTTPFASTANIVTLKRGNV
jgi:hypothetical protein